MNRLDEFYGLVETLKAIINMLKDVFTDKNGLKVQSQRLQQLATLKALERGDKDANTDAEMKSDNSGDAADGIFPDYLPILQEFEDMVVWKQHKGKKIPEPRWGVDPEFDDTNKKVEAIHQRMQDYLKDVQKDTGCDKAKLFTS